MAAVVGMLALTALSATLEVVAEGTVGMILAHIKVLDVKSTRVLTNLGYYVTLPCMNMYRLASGVSLEMMKTVWIVSLYSLFFIIISNILARIVFIRRFWGKRIRSAIEQTMYIYSVTFNNAVSLPFVFVGALCLSGSDLFPDSQKAVSQAVAFISIYSIANAGVFWTYGLSSLKKLAEEKKSEEANTEHESTTIPMTVDLKPVSPDYESHSETILNSDNDENSTEITITPTEIPPSPQEDIEIEQRPQTWPGYAKEKLKVVTKTIITGFKSLLTPPFLSLGIGLTIACINPLKNFLVIEPPPIISSIMHVAKLFSDATFAVSMIVLGSNLYSTFMSNQSKDADEKRIKRKGFKKIACFVCDKFIQHNDPIAMFLCVILRLIVMPIIGVGVILGSVQLGILPREDSVLLLVLLVEASTPTAINLNNLANLCDGVGQDQVCEILLFMYACSPITLSCFATINLYLIKSLT
jgi:predicted permease